MIFPTFSAFAPKQWLIAGVVFALATGMTLLSWQLLLVSQRAAALRTFEEKAARVEVAIQDRLRMYEQVLRGGGGLFAASATIGRDEWRRYVAAAQLRNVFPGALGLHVAMRVNAADLATHVAQIRRESFADYRIRPDGARDEYYPVVWPEPLTNARNRQAMGYDIVTEPVRLAAIEQSRDSGKPTMSGKVTLIGDAKAPVPGFVFYYPIYARDQPIATVEERRRAISAYILCPIRMPDLMSGLTGAERDVLDVEIFDGTAPSAESILYDDDGSLRTLRLAAPEIPMLRREMNFAGRSWTLQFVATDKHLAAVDQTAPRLLLLAGMLASVLITALILRLLGSEATAQSAALRDGLTGLFNRRYLEASLAREQERARRKRLAVAIVQFDFDYFKSLNDTFGHAAGDEVLRRVGELLRSTTRGEDIACRYGGEEFTLILPGTTREQAEKRANDLGRQIASMEFSLEGQSLPRITISGGVAAYPADGASLAVVLTRADQALLRAKREGRARILPVQPDDPVTTGKFAVPRAG